MIIKKNQSYGFTLVEVVIYSALIGLVLTGFISVAVNASIINTKQGVITEVIANVRQAQNVLSRNIRQADYAIYPTPGETGSSLFLAMPDGEEIRFYVVNNQLLELASGGGAVSLISSLVKIDNVIFKNIGNTGRDSIIFSFDISYKDADSNEFEYQISYESAITLRN